MSELATRTAALYEKLRDIGRELRTLNELAIQSGHSSKFKADESDETLGPSAFENRLRLTYIDFASGTHDAIHLQVVLGGGRSPEKLAQLGVLRLARQHQN